MLKNYEQQPNEKLEDYLKRIGIDPALENELEVSNDDLLGDMNGIVKEEK